MIDREDCMLWAGYKSEQGYGQMFAGGERYIAHRLSYEKFVGEIPDGLVIDHLCSVRCCINPDHLEAVTARENTLRGEGVKINARKTHCPKRHEYTVENTTRYSSPWRRCRECDKQRHREYYAANKAKWKLYNS